MTLVATVLQYALWPSLTFAMLVLWALGMLDIDRHRRKRTSTGAGLLCMAGCVSLAAIFAVASIGAVFADPWTETVSKDDPSGLRAGEPGNPAGAPIFSFGLENASYAPAGPAGEGGDDGAPR